MILLGVFYSSMELIFVAHNPVEVSKLLQSSVLLGVKAEGSS